MCEDARKLDPSEVQAKILEINSEWNNICGITEDIITAKIKTTPNGLAIHSIGEGALIVKSDEIKDPRCEYSFNGVVKTQIDPAPASEIPYSTQTHPGVLDFCF